MQAAVLLKAKQLEIREIPMPNAGAGEVRVRVAATGVCGTDLHLFEGHFGAVFPLVAGHEIAGVIDQVGAGVLGLQEGDHVALDPNISCGQCYHCRRGMQHHCQTLAALGVTRGGGFAEYVIAPATNAYPIGTLDLETAAFAEPLGCIAWGIKRLQPEIGSKALLFGAGPIGLLLMQALLISGVSEVTVVEPNFERRAVAMTLGAKRVLEPNDSLKTQLFDLEPYGFDVVTEATGIPAVLSQLPQYAIQGGKIMYYGVPPEEARVSINPYDLFRRDLTILGSFSLHGTLHHALRWLSSGLIQVKPLITHRLPISQLGLALEYKNQPGLNGSQKTMIIP